MELQELKALDIKKLITDLTDSEFRKDSLKTCPFCCSGSGRNKTSAFNVAKNKFKCFSCGEQGSTIDFVTKFKKLSVGEAVQFLKEKYNFSDTAYSAPRPDFATHTEGLNEVFVQTREKFTDFELRTLGRKVTPAVCDAFNCEPVQFYITAAKEGKPSYKISSTETYPIYLFSYKTTVGEVTYDFKRVYQPLGEKTHRFFWVGKKPENYIFADQTTRKVLDLVKANVEVSERSDRLIICSGTSDAMNVYAEGINKESGKSKYSVVWLNSENAYETFEDKDYKDLQKLTKEIYLLPDLDKTGTRTAHAFALKYLDTKLIWLPADMAKQTANGSPLKDAKDFFNRYRTSRYQSLNFYFKELVRVSNPLKFWDETVKRNKDGDVIERGFYLSNERIYQFLQANGFCRIPSKTDKKTWVFAHINGNVVRVINDESIAEYTNTFIVNFFKMNLSYFDARLIDKIHKSNEFKTNSLSKLKLVEDLDFKLATAAEDFFIFKNNAWKITADGFETVPSAQITKHIYDFKVVDFDASRLKEPLFDVQFSDLYNSADDKDKLEPEDRYTLKLNSEFSFMKYLYNTGRVHWRKEAAGEPLTVWEQKQHDLFFISKVAALGYTLYNFKEDSKAWAVYTTDTELAANGEHKGGTGKSVFLKMLHYGNLRSRVYLDGQKQNLNNFQFVFGNVTEHTDFIYVEDLDKSVDLHKYMNVINGDMEVEPKNVQPFTIPFTDSPKLCFSSNHGIGNLDGSLRRRLWFVGFSDFYHAADPNHGIKEYSPKMEFGKNLVADYDNRELNEFFNFLAQCVVVYLRFRDKIESPSEFIEKRNILRKVGDALAEWADDYFVPELLNILLNRDEVFESFTKSLSDKNAKFYSNDRKWKEKLELFCHSKGWVLNPPESLINEDERSRRRIRRQVDGKRVEYLFVQTPDKTQVPEAEVMAF